MLFAVGVCTKVPELSGLLLQKDSVTAKQERAEKKTEAKFKKIEKMIDQYYLYSDDVKQDDLEDAVYADLTSSPSSFPVSSRNCTVFIRRPKPSPPAAAISLLPISHPRNWSQMRRST